MLTRKARLLKKFAKQQALFAVTTRSFDDADIEALEHRFQQALTRKELLTVFSEFESPTLLANQYAEFLSAPILQLVSLKQYGAALLMCHRLLHCKQQHATSSLLFDAISRLQAAPLNNTDALTHLQLMFAKLVLIHDADYRVVSDVKAFSYRNIATHRSREALKQAIIHFYRMLLPNVASWIKDLVRAKGLDPDELEVNYKQSEQTFDTNQQWQKLLDEKKQIQRDEEEARRYVSEEFKATIQGIARIDSPMGHVEMKHRLSHAIQIMSDNELILLLSEDHLNVSQIQHPTCQNLADQFNATILRKRLLLTLRERGFTIQPGALSSMAPGIAERILSFVTNPHRQTHFIEDRWSEQLKQQCTTASLVGHLDALQLFIERFPQFTDFSPLQNLTNHLLTKALKLCLSNHVNFHFRKLIADNHILNDLLCTEVLTNLWEMLQAWHDRKRSVSIEQLIARFIPYLKTPKAVVYMRFGISPWMYMRIKKIEDRSNIARTFLRTLDATDAYLSLTQCNNKIQLGDVITLDPLTLHIAHFIVEYNAKSLISRCPIELLPHLPLLVALHAATNNIDTSLALCRSMTNEQRGFFQGLLSAKSQVRMDQANAIRLTLLLKTCVAYNGENPHATASFDPAHLSTLLFIMQRKWFRGFFFRKSQKSQAQFKWLCIFLSKSTQLLRSTRFQLLQQCQSPIELDYLVRMNLNLLIRINCANQQLTLTNPHARLIRTILSYKPKPRLLAQLFNENGMHCFKEYPEHATVFLKFIKDNTSASTVQLAQKLIMSPNTTDLAGKLRLLKKSLFN